MTIRKPQVTTVCAKPPGGLCSLCPGGRGWLGSGAIPPPIIPVPVCLGQRGPARWSAWPWKGCQDSSPLCCAQDCESKKPPRSQHRCKLPRVSLQAGAWFQVHPTQQRMDLDPETKRCSSFIGASGPWDTQKVAQSCLFTSRWPIELHLTL